MVGPPPVRDRASIRVKGHGPAMQEARALRNWFPGPASREIEPLDALHLPSGEQRSCPAQGTFPLFPTSNVLTALPTFAAVTLLIEYRTSTLPIVTSGPLGFGIASG